MGPTTDTKPRTSTTSIEAQFAALSAWNSLTILMVSARESTAAPRDFSEERCVVRDARAWGSGGSSWAFCSVASGETRPRAASISATSHAIRTTPTRLGSGSNRRNLVPRLSSSDPFKASQTRLASQALSTMVNRRDRLPGSILRMLPLIPVSAARIRSDLDIFAVVNRRERCSGWPSVVTPLRESQCWDWEQKERPGTAEIPALSTLTLRGRSAPRRNSNSRAAVGDRQMFAAHTNKTLKLNNLTRTALRHRLQLPNRVRPDSTDGQQTANTGSSHA